MTSQNQNINWVQQFNKLEEQGLIQAFEYTYELAWLVMKDFLEHEGNKNIYGSG